eukprot:CAMPEP_0181112940 /NCGR_PEP_ID=MMETSP1071-20121207/20077_1 /TAXON_ID=35127 /ORGANISM="Thalassiosira sp., Strain NH16" /LENGTH=187 /DNA_ID=CAMNT_0023196935 /DNA_START=199 /DNA_END=760 /DNA_ORIENTATION=+
MRSSQSGRQHCRPPSSSSSSSVAIAGSSSSSSSLAATDRQLQRAVRLSQYRIVDDDNTTVLLRSRYPSSSVATSIPVLVNDASAAPTATASASSPSIPTLDLRHSHLLRSSVPSPSPIIAKRRQFAHVDAGKTTVTERILALSGSVREAGSVDTGDTVTDYLPMEWERGITIQSAAVGAQAQTETVW